MGCVPTPPVDNSRAVQALLIVLSVTAGCTDVIGFLVLNGLFTAHITGNLVILAAHIVGGGEAQIAPMLSVPVFIVMVGLTRLVAGGGIDRPRLTSPTAAAPVPVARRLSRPLRHSLPTHRPERDKCDPRGHARRLGDGRAERTRADLA